MPSAGDIALIYDAAVDPSLWPAVLERMVDRVGGSHGSLVMERSGGGGDGVIARMDPAVLRQYLPQCHTSEPLTFNPSIAAGQFLTDRQMASRQELTSSRYYREFLRPVGINSLVTALLWRGADFKCCINLTRSPREEEFDANDLAPVRELGPHLVRAIGVSLRLREASLVSRGDEAVLDRLPHGVILLDRRGGIQFVNREGEAILAARDGLASRPGGLAGARQSDSERLAGAIAKAAAGEGSALRIWRPSGRRPFVVLVAPFRLATDWLSTASSSMIVTVTDPERNPVTSEARLMQLYGLTRAEAAIAVRLLNGQDLAEIAQERCVSPRTVRIHLSQIFAKTGASRQADLVRVLLIEGVGPL
jgi:DNA-binding CsgD family transcriptional regulator/PAS domain-containing protein